MGRPRSIFGLVMALVLAVVVMILGRPFVGDLSSDPSPPVEQVAAGEVRPPAPEAAPAPAPGSGVPALPGRPAALAAADGVPTPAEAAGKSGAEGGEGLVPEAALRESVEFVRRTARAAAGQMTAKDYEQLAAAAEVDGELAMQLFYYVRSCIGQPRAPEQVEARLDYWDARLGTVDSVDAARTHERMLMSMEVAFERCGGLEDYDLVAVAVDWLQRAAGSGYVPAQVDFYEALPALLRRTQDRLFREPHYIDLHREQSRHWLEAALGAGHPDALAVVARALTHGVIYAPDRMLALAYARAAEQAGSEDPQLGQLIDELDAEVTPGDRLAAASEATTICARFGC